MHLDIGPLTILTVAFGAMLVRAVIRHLKGKPSFTGIGVAAIALWLVMTSWCGWFEVRHQVTQATATRVVQQITGNDDARAVCRRRSADWWDTSGYLGMVSWDSPDVAVLRTDTCNDLSDWLFSSRTAPDLQQGTALHVLVHEAVHVAGERDEAVTECSALAIDAVVVASLGASEADAASMVSDYLRERYPYQSPEYVTDCSAVVPAVPVADVIARTS